MSQEIAVVKGVSLYPVHWALIEQYAAAHNLRGSQTRSPALQAILDHYMQLTGAVVSVEQALALKEAV